MLYDMKKLTIQTWKNNTEEMVRIADVCDSEQKVAILIMLITRR